jgi:hypothetical protein
VNAGFPVGLPVREGCEEADGSGSRGAAGPAGDGDDFLPLPGGEWTVWRGLVLRSAGFPAGLVDRLGDPTLADVADRCLQGRVDTGRRRLDPRALERYEAEFDAAADRVAAATEEVARDSRFREALAWQESHVPGNVC